MSMMQIKIGNRTLPVNVYDAVRIGHDTITNTVQRMANQMDAEYEYMMDTLDIGEIHQYFSSTGDLMVHGIVERGTDGLYAEIYVTTITRSVSFNL